MPRSMDARKQMDDLYRVLKRVQDVVDGFLNKVNDAENENQREIEANLKKEMQKLLRYREQIKMWIQSTEVKEKRVLMDVRKQIDREMERFKICEMEKKNKLFSKEGLGQKPEMEDFDEFIDIEKLYNGLPMEKLEEHEDMFSLASLSRVEDVASVSTGAVLSMKSSAGTSPTETMELNILERIIEGSEEPSRLDFQLLQSITENFSEKKRIGTGGCGDVYKGILRNGAVAVKRLFKSQIIKDKMFDREVISLIGTRHENVVRLLGYCFFKIEHVITLQGEPTVVDLREKLLCFEYMCNGSLDNHLADELRGLEWDTRYQIIMGICKGLLYLHNEKDIIHMDLKPSNIVLDVKMVPKITDFGLSRIDNNSQTSTTLRISPGYCAPEYLLDGESSSKSDIYSLGVTILELVTGCKKKPDHKALLWQVLRRWRHRWIKSSENTPLSYQQVSKCLELAQRCMQHDPKCRPDISDIVDELNKIDSKDDQFHEIPRFQGMLGIEPLEIHIPFEHDQQISHSIELTNDTDDYIAFITKATLHRLSTEPDQGIVPPRSKCSVTVTMKALVHALPNNHCKGDITVLSTRVDGGLAAMDTTEDMFTDEEGKVVDEVNVMVVLGKPTQPEES